MDVAQETDPRLAGGVEGGAPCFHPDPWSVFWSHIFPYGRGTYTKGSLTDTTKTLPASFNLSLLTYPGMCVAEHAGPGEQSHAISLDTSFSDLYQLLIYYAISDKLSFPPCSMSWK